MIDNIDPAVRMDLLINENLPILYKKQYEKIALETINSVKNKTVIEKYNNGKPIEKHINIEADTWYIPTKMFTYPIMYKSLIERYGEKKYKTGIDIGFGMTTFFEFIKEVENIILVDISDVYCEYMKRKNIGKVVCGNIENMDFIESNSCDLIICSDILEHVLSLNKAIKEINRISTSNSVLLINIPIDQRMSADGMDGSWLNLSSFTHLRSFSLNKIKEFFKEWRVIDERVISEGEQFGWIKTVNLILEKPND